MLWGTFAGDTSALNITGYKIEQTTHTAYIIGYGQNRLLHYRL